MKALSLPLLLCSLLVTAFLLCGSLLAKTSEDSSWRQVVLFSEILALVSDNYVDPVSTDDLLAGAFEGMLAGLDAQGAYLTRDEVQEWKRFKDAAFCDPGLSVLKAGRGLQVVGLVPGSPAAESSVEIGDRVRAVDGQPVQDLSLAQAWRLLRGAAGSRVQIDLLHSQDSFRRESVELHRAVPDGPSYRLGVLRGMAHLRLFDLARLDVATLGQELEDLESRGVSELVVDVRNLAGLHAGDAARAARGFVPGAVLQLRDRSGRLLETFGDADTKGPMWDGPLAVLVNGATAGSAEGLATLIRSERGGIVVGEPTYGLGAEPVLYEMEDGSGVLVSSKLWETASGVRWNGDGIKPDEVIHGKGDDFEAVSADQLERALDYLEQKWKATRDAARRQAA